MNPDLVKTFVSLLALVNPLGAVPFFISLTTEHTPSERKRVVRVASLSVALVILIATLAGQQIIGFFGISIASLQVGGGIVMLLMSINMVNAHTGGTRYTAEEADEAELKQSIAVVPLAIPLLTGPGTISTVIIYANKAHDWRDIAGLIGSGAVIGLLTFVALSAAGPTSRALGRTGINIATRLMGLMLAALAIEFITDGLQELLPALRH